MAGDDYAIGSCQDGIDEAKLFDRGCDLRNLCVAMRARVASIRGQFVEGSAFDLEVEVLWRTVSDLWFSDFGRTRHLISLRALHHAR
jgi:hypothetical protein